MRRCLSAFAIAIFLPALACSQDGDRASNSPSGRTARVTPSDDVIRLQDSFANVAQTIEPAVVNISAVQIQKVDVPPQQFFYGDPNEFFRRFFGGEAPGRRQAPPPQEFRMEGTGSGIVIDPAGYILTNNHVIQGATQLTVTVSDREYRGKVVGTDLRSDLAVVKIDGSNPFKHLPMGDSDAMRIGDWVMAAGSPFGLEQTYTAGIVSAIRQSLNIEGKVFRNLLQTDAAINRGNSGGPLVNMRGELIGVNTAIYAPTGVFSGIGFAIPINEAKSIVKELIEQGYVERSWLGVEIAPVDEVIANQFGLKEAQGALINRVVPDSPADRGGLKRGDIITHVEGKEIAGPTELQEVISSAKPGRKISVTYVREGEPRKRTITPQLMPRDDSGPRGQSPAPESAAPDEWMGAQVATATPELVARLGLPEGTQGAVVISVPVDSEAAEMGLVEGDLIRSINRKRIDGTRELKQTDVDLKKGVVMDVIREQQPIYLSYRRPG